MQFRNGRMWMFERGAGVVVGLNCMFLGTSLTVLIGGRNTPKANTPKADGQNGTAFTKSEPQTISGEGRQLKNISENKGR